MQLHNVAPTMNSQTKNSRKPLEDTPSKSGGGGGGGGGGETGGGGGSG